MAWSSSSSPPVSMEAILARIARLEARLEAKEQRWAPAFPPSRGEAEPLFGLPDWRLPMWDPGSHQATTPAATTFATSLPAVQHQPLPAHYDAARPPLGFCHPSPQSRRPPLPQQAPWDSPWLRTNHELPLPQQAPWDSPWLCFNHEPSPAPQPSLADPHVPWESPWQPSHAPPSLTESVPCPVAEEAADSKGLGATENQDPSFVHATSGSGIGDGDANKAAQSSAADTNDNEFEKTLECTDALMVRGSKVAKERDYREAIESYRRALKIEVVKGALIAPACVCECACAHYKFGWALLYQAQEEADPLGFISNKKGEGLGKERLKSRVINQRLVIFGLYALAEVYKDLHLEDKVIFKGGGVDTLFRLF